MIINISLKPRPGRWDIHIPIPIITKPSNDPTINATEKEILDLFKDYDSHVLEVTENNGPIPWSERVAKVLKKHGFKATVYNKLKDHNYFTNQDYLFPNSKKPYYLFLNPYETYIRDFIEVYKKQTLQIEEPINGVCGHYYRGKMLWTQIQNSYDTNKSPNKKFMEQYKEVLQTITPFIEELLLKKNIKDRITLRIVDYINQKDINKTLGSHIDMSFITSVLYQDQPGLHVRNFLSDELSIDCSEIVDVSRPLLSGVGILFPGNSYCEETESWTPACWHGVEMLPEIKRRVSFLVRVENE